MVKIRVPGTTANLGPGFDTLGLALNIYNEFTFQEIPEGFVIDGFEKGYNSKDNLVYKSMMETFKEINYQPRGISIEANIDIPISRGLGSSASCILGGVMGANEIAGGPLSKEDIFQIGSRIEGHPDNIAPALFGGLTISLMEDDNIIYNKLEVHEGLKFLALIPDFTLSTKEAREVLPSNIKFADGVSNVARVSLLLSALGRGRFDLLKYALKDRLHEPYRGKLIPDFFHIIKATEDIGSLGTYLSGAGPTIMCIIEENKGDIVEKIDEYLDSLQSKWTLRELIIDLQGAKVL